MLTMFMRRIISVGIIGLVLLAGATSSSVAQTQSQTPAAGGRPAGPPPPDPKKPQKLEITTPEENLGDIVGDLQKRRATITETLVRGRNTVIMALAPLATLFGYAGAIRSLSQGRASCSMEPSAYGPAPDEVADTFRL